MTTEVSTEVKALTVEQFKRVMPNTLSKNKVTQDMVDNLNGLMTDQALRENYRDNLLSYTSVMKDPRYKVPDYLNAVRYVSYKLLGASNIEAYTKTFPDRFQRLIAEQADDKTISSYCAAYNRTQLVNKIMEQTLIPNHVLNADLHQKAINRQAYLMMHASSEKVQSDAANSVLMHTKAPEKVQMELDITHKADKSIDSLRATTQALVDQQREALQNGGMHVKDVAHSKIIEVEGEVID